MKALRHIIVILSVVGLFQFTASGQGVDTLVSSYLNLPKDETTVTKIIRNISSIGYNSAAGKALIDYGLELSTSMNFEKGSKRLIYVKAISYYLDGDYDRAAEQIQKSITLYNTGDDHYNFFNARNLACSILTKSGNFLEAQRCFQAAIHELEAVIPQKDSYTPFTVGDMKDRLASLYSDLSSLYADIGEMQKSISIQEKVLAIYDEIENNRGLSIALNNMATRYNDLGEFKRAETYLLDSYAITKQLENERSLSIRALNLAQNYVLQGKFRKSKKYADMVQKKIEQLDEPLLSSAFYDVRGMLLSHENKHAKADEYFDKALTAIEHIAFAESRIDILQNKYENLKKAGNLHKALVAHEAYTEELNIKNESDFGKKIAVAQMEWEQERTIDELKDTHNQEISVFEQKVTDLSTTQNLLIAGLVILLGFFSLLYFLFKNKRTYSQILELKNSQLEKSVYEKNILLREIHHRVKNNLQVISSLLNLQSNYISDDAALAAINEGKNRVGSMALIHQNLYQDENVTSINAREYFSELVSNLYDSYEISEGEIELEMHIDALMIDVDTMIPLGLVVNELISNTLKHAFTKHTKDKKLMVSLTEQHNRILLKVRDNGSGISQDDFMSSESFGNKLIKAFQQKLEADLTIHNHDGTDILFAISRYKLAG